MTDYIKLIEALRWCDADFIHECDNCLYVKYKYDNGNWKAVDLFGQRWVVIHPTHWMPIEPPKEDAL